MFGKFTGTKNMMTYTYIAALVSYFSCNVLFFSVHNIDETRFTAQAWLRNDEAADCHGMTRSGNKMIHEHKSGLIDESYITLKVHIRRYTFVHICVFFFFHARFRVPHLGDALPATRFRDRFHLFRRWQCGPNP
jgi:hypothetical protein